ncbi:zinc finger, CCHC-type containing protein [Tanacetum coccineum]
MSDKTDETLDNTLKPTVTEMEIPVKETERNNEAKNKLIKKAEEKEVVEGLKHVNTLVDQGSDVNVIPYSTYMKLTDERPAEIDIILSLASHSYIYPLGIVEDVLVEVAEHVYPVDFVVLDIKENEKRPFILGTPLLTTDKAVIKFDKGTITLRSRKTSPGMGRKDKASLGKGDGVQPIEEQKFQRQASHSYYNQGRNEGQKRSHVRTCDFESSYKTRKIKKSASWEPT